MRVEVFTLVMSVLKIGWVLVLYLLKEGAADVAVKKVLQVRVEVFAQVTEMSELEITAVLKRFSLYLFKKRTADVAVEKVLEVRVEALQANGQVRGGLRVRNGAAEQVDEPVERVPVNRGCEQVRRVC